MVYPRISYIRSSSSVIKMSYNYIPFEIQVEIMKNLPVKSLIQFRSVSKSWKHLIDSSYFIVRHHSGLNSDELKYLLIADELKDILIADDDTFPHNKVPLTRPQQYLLGNRLKYPWLLGCSYGLVCLFCDGLDGSMSMAVVWNPCIRKAVFVDVDMPHMTKGTYDAVVGFGVCCETRDPKLVKITYIRRGVDIASIDCIPRQVDVFTLSGGVWRRPKSNLPRKSIYFHTSQVVINGFLYLLAVDRDSRGELNVLISFDLTSEEFREVHLPHSLAYWFPTCLILSKLRESLVVIQEGRDDNDQDFVVWKMEDGVPKSFTKLLFINTDTLYVQFMGFTKSDDPIIQIYEDDYKLVVYTPCTRHIDDLRIDGIGRSVDFYPYVETLLLHDQPNLKMFCLGN